MSKAKGQLEENPYFKKYAQRIQELQMTKPEEFLKRLQECQEKVKSLKAAETKQVVYGEKKGPSIPLTKKPKTLDEYMKISLLEDKSKEEVVNIWTEFHKNKEVVFGTLAKDVYNTLCEHSEKYPTFLLPLPRQEGYEFIVLQFEGNEVHFTPLISYQAYKADAPECLTLVYYPELVDSKGVVLIKGVFDKNIMSSLEAQCLVNTLHLYYGETDEKRLNLMHTFTHSPDNFRYMDLVAEMDIIPLKG